MADALTLQRRPALAGRALAGCRSTAVNLVAADPRAILNLRAPPDDAGLQAAIREFTGVALPLEPCRWNGDVQCAAAWLGPDEWLLVANERVAADVANRLQRVIDDGAMRSLVDLSHNYSGLRLSGPAARDLLSKGCPLDLHPRTFRPGDCAQTLLAGSQVFLRCLDQPDTFDLLLRNSFIRYAAAWLADALLEYRG